jgi:acyl dehydratase
VLDGFSLLIDAVRLAGTPSVTLDAFVGHVDADYARAQGHPGPFMNSLPMLGLLDRLVTDWAGPHTFICRHKMNLVRPAYCGETITVTGAVVSLDDTRRPGFGREPVACSLVGLEALLTTAAGDVGRGELTVALPRR